MRLRCRPLEQLATGDGSGLLHIAGNVGIVPVSRRHRRAIIQGWPRTARRRMALACNPAVNPIANGSYTGRAEEEEFSGTASLAYHLNEDVMVYGGYSRGYKAGGFNIDRSGFTITPATTSPTAAALQSRVCVRSGVRAGVHRRLRSRREDRRCSAARRRSTSRASSSRSHDYQLEQLQRLQLHHPQRPGRDQPRCRTGIATNPMEGLNINAGVVYTDAYYDSTVYLQRARPGPEHDHRRRSRSRSLRNGL
jgi:hypothetical protein